MTTIRKISSAEKLMKASKEANFDIREYAKWARYSMTGIRLNGTVLGE